MKPASPSLIAVELTVKNDQIESLMAGGKGKVMKTMDISF